MPDSVLRSPCVSLRKPAAAPRRPFLAWADRVQRTFFCSQRALCWHAVALFRSVKALFLPKRGDTVGLRGTSVVPGGAFDGLPGLVLV